jgi:hypothetical protein
MSRILQFSARNRLFVVCAASLALLVMFAAVLVNCGGSGSVMHMSAGTGTVNLSISDPPVCKFPNGAFDHVFVTIRSVRAHINPDAEMGTAGWQELAPQLMNQPVQIDLFAAGPNGCLLTLLGSNTGLPAGTYQQIRLLLVANDGGNGPLPASNACGNQGFNCVVLHDGSVHQLLLSSEAVTGLKIPPGQILGGPITVAAGQDVDLNIDFDACRSIKQEGNGQFRLKPVLGADQVSQNHTGIGGHVVDAGTGAAIAGGTVLVALETQDASGADIIFMQTATDIGGNFNFCPLPAGTTFDVVAVAINGAGVAYNATVAVGIPGGTDLGAIPLVAETGLSTAPGTLQGFVTATTGVAAVSIDATVSAQQPISLGGGVMRFVTIPLEGNSVAKISVDSNAGCPLTAPMNTNCAQFTLIVPASNASVGVFSGGKITYAPPPAGDVLFTARADAFSSTTGNSDCTKPSLTTSLDTTGNPLKVTAGATSTPQEIDFSGCS